MDENIARFLRQSAAHLGIRVGFLRNAGGVAGIQRTLAGWRKGGAIARPARGEQGATGLNLRVA
jgi:hypothetical protein